MSDFEDKLRDALGSGADESPDAHGLADGARTKARTRRRTATSVVAAVAIVAIAVPLGAFALRDSGSDRSGGPTVDTSDTSAPDGFRTESWRDLEIEVPNSWGYGNLATWCLNGQGEPGNPVVERPGGAVHNILCTDPGSGYGAQFFGASRRFDREPGQVLQQNDSHGAFPDGAWAGYATFDGDTSVSVVLDDEQTAQRILDSARHIDGVDSNGCAPEAADAPESGEDDSVSVCRYGSDGWLQQSELLTGQDAEDAIAALEAAPETFYSPPCAAPLGGDQPQTEYALLIASDATYTVQWTGSTCPYHGVFVGDDIRRKLTPEVMYWALSPGWSGGVDGDVPLPPELRQ